MENNINYEKLTKQLISSVNFFLEKPEIILDVSENEISINFLKRNLIIKELSKYPIDDLQWKRLYFNIFKCLIEIKDGK